MTWEVVLLKEKEWEQWGYRARGPDLTQLIVIKFTVINTRGREKERG